MGMYGAGGFPLAATLAQPVRPPMRKAQQFDRTTDLGLPTDLDRHIRHRAEMFFNSQSTPARIRAPPETDIEAEMRGRTEQFVKTQAKRYRDRPR